MDLNRIAQLGQEGILLLMADSTNVEEQGILYLKNYRGNFK